MFIHSDINIGTKIIISLVRSGIPNWFCETLNIQFESMIVVLDDDPSIHDAWNEKFSKMPNTKIVHFYHTSELTLHQLDSAKTALYLIDYELLGDEKNGLDMIDEFKLNKKAILVTSCFEELTLRIRCENMGVKIIPKSNVPYIQITQLANEDVKLVFIDDDEVMRAIWGYAAEEAGRDIYTYSSFEEFVTEMDIYSKDTLIYIDSDLGNNTKGEICAKYIFDKGFTEIYLATGHPSDRFNNMPWIKSIIGKEPPFL
jgi:hypothetical protein